MTVQATPMLTDRQKYVLQWLLANPQSRMRWMRNGKDAYGPPEKWDAMEISGAQGSIIIATGDWEAIRPFKRICSYRETGKAFVPNEVGLAVLATPPEQVNP